ncbi:hypothetical protein BM536_007700 [Streptomyces phaeoluteigriseus]|uniref:Gram-positive cocci surface proteins LPxTG domain-containing protein n=1 Tax=Streptomyces phaeoluteigriseus TaxID=114686 RepID=A0A1V6MWI5_9ACTN|nr:hypothetical protein [Streptomyces phaeoluteigriseus]OQD56828.1 hypothetical protein BM536_007700 [Streptomyces phaeoluteigriseus]
MRSARTLLAAATVTAALAIAAPVAYASSAGDSGKDDHSYSSDHEYKKDEDKDAGGEHDKPKGGVHTGGGLFATVGGDDWDEKDEYKKDHEYKDEDKKDEYKKDEDKDAGAEHDKPKGGVHTGGGGLAPSGSPAAAGGLALLAGLGAGAYVLRRRIAGGAA